MNRVLNERLKFGVNFDARKVEFYHPMTDANLDKYLELDIKGYKSGKDFTCKFRLDGGWVNFDIDFLKDFNGGLVSLKISDPYLVRDKYSDKTCQHTEAKFWIPSFRLQEKASFDQWEPIFILGVKILDILLIAAHILGPVLILCDQSVWYIIKLVFTINFMASLVLLDANPGYLIDGFQKILSESFFTGLTVLGLRVAQDKARLYNGKLNANVWPWLLQNFDL